MAQYKDIVDHLIDGTLPKSAASKNAPRDEKAQQAYQALKRYYLLDKNETSLLQKSTGCDTYLLEIAYDKANSQKLDYIQLLKDEIQRRIQYNQNRYFWQSEQPVDNLNSQLQYLQQYPLLRETNSFTWIAAAYEAGLLAKKNQIIQANANRFISKSTKHLDIARSFVKYHKDARQYLMHASSIQIQEKSPLRPADRSFLGAISKLWAGLWGVNANLRKLADQHKQKTTLFQNVLGKLKLKADDIASEVYQGGAPSVVTHFAPVDGKEASAPAIIQMKKITGEGYQSFFLDDKLTFPAFLQADINAAKQLLMIRKHLLELANGLGNQKQLDTLNTRIDNFYKIYPNPFDANTNGKLTLLNSDFQECKSISANHFDLGIIKDMCQRLDSLKVSDIVPSSLQTAPPYVTTYRTKYLKWSQLTLEKLQEQINLPQLGSLTPLRAVKNLALMEPSAAYPRDEFANDMINATASYQTSIETKYSSNELSDVNAATLTNVQQRDAFLTDLNEVVKANRLKAASSIRAFMTFAKDASSEPQKETIVALGTLAQTVTSQNNQGLEPIAKQRDFLNVYLKNLQQLKEDYQNSAVTPGDQQIMETFIDKVAPKSSATDNRNHLTRLDSFIRALRPEGSYMNDVMFDGLKAKQATKFITGQLSYQLNTEERGEMVRRTLDAS